MINNASCGENDDDNDDNNDNVVTGHMSPSRSECLPIV